MKKLVAIITVVSVVLCSINVDVKASNIGFDSEFFSGDDKIIGYLENDNLLENSTLSISAINRSSWKELKKLSKTVNTEEDRNIKLLIEGINKPQKMTDYKSEEYVLHTINDIPLKDIDYDRFLEKVKGIIEIYNYYHDLQLEYTSEILNENYMKIVVISKNVDYLENPVEYIGQLARIRFGANYWESAENFGSGKNGIVNKNNVNIPENCIVIVDGVTYLNDGGNEVSSSFNILEKIEVSENRMLHITANGNDVGWIYPTNLKSIDR